MKPASLNPFSHQNTSLSPHLLMLAKLLWLGLIGKAYLPNFPTPFLPFLDIFDQLPASEFQLLIVIIFVISGCMLLLNRYVRIACILLSLTIFLSILSSKTYFSNARYFCVLLFLFVALSDKDKRPWLLQIQFIIIYFFTGFNKILEPDWRSGVYFDHWMKAIIHAKSYIFLTSVFGDLFIAKLFSWSTIIVELVILPVCLSFRKWHAWGIWIGILFHSSAFWLSGLSFGIFFPGLMIGYLCFASYPTKVGLLLPAKGFIKTIYQKIISPADFDHRFTTVVEGKNKDVEKTIDLTQPGIIQLLINRRNVLVNLPLTYYLIMAMMTFNYLPGFMQHLGALSIIILFCPLYDKMERWLGSR